MRHPTEGVLRRLLDEPGGVADADRAHVADCDRCRRALDVVRDDADAVHAALATGTVDVDLASAWQRLTATAAPAPGRPGAQPRTGRLRAALRRPATGAVAVALVLAGAGTAAANDWLQIFQTEQVAPVSITTADLVALPDLSAYGDLDITRRPDVQDVPDAATAAFRTGLDLPDVAALPRGVRGTPTYQVGNQVTATFTFSTARAERAAARAGKALPTPPPGLDGSSVRLVAGPGVAQVWRSSAGAPALVVARAVAPRAFSSGLPFETVRDYVLSLPGLPADVAAQLRTFAADGSTLPLPVPTERLTSSPADVNGVPATVLVARDRTMAAAVWVQKGIVTVVAGSLDADEVLTVARALR